MAIFRIPLKVGSVILSVAIGLTLNLSESSEANNKTQPQSGVGRAPDSQDSDALKLKTTLVIVPVIASDHNGIYIPDMQKNEVTLLEDGVKQNIAFFAITSEPFNVILMLDTSRSTSQKLGQIKQAAIAFVDQLRPLDRVKVISFDDEVRDLKGFTSDKATLRSAIERTRTGGSTRLYDAFRLALENLRRQKGRKAIVLLTDGVDTRSHSTTYADNLRELEESGVIVYPIRYDTRAETEAMLRQRARQVEPRDTSVARPPPEPPRPDQRPNNRSISGLPWPSDQFPDARKHTMQGSPGMIGDYDLADKYINELANSSGGILHRADTIASLPEAFARIAAELRAQYALGYYPSNTLRDRTYRKIQVRTDRADAVIRTRPGYRALSSRLR